MSGQTWLESSLTRSSVLGLQVLERAKRRSVDWASVSASGKLSQADNGQRNHNDGVGAENFYKSAPVQEPSTYEVNHVYRYHSQRLPGALHQRISEKTEKLTLGEDFHIEVSPGTYSITAGTGDSDQQTRLVQVNAGESVNLTFHL
ncbi:A-kinase-interacting protein 1 isoform X2 [Megalops cyprinoides]|uniref:A-kinase-interacting protein 1 isoform X2 n=1 Tax=Megalops cyprinoides TaxID=118141 RepID=UPI001864F83D|nr:A-kinase-interacting protein 1 isoform X2 [Megalops cyprinoides]